MNGTRTFCFAIAAAAPLVGIASFAAAAREESMVDRFSAADTHGQQQILARMDRNQVASIDQAELESLLTVATKSPSLDVRSEALAVTNRLLLRDPAAAKRVAGVAFLTGLLSDGSEETALSAFDFSILLHRGDKQVRDAAERRLRGDPVEPKFDRRLVRYLSTERAISATVIEVLEGWASIRDDSLGFEATAALARLDSPPPDVAAWILRIGASKQFFAHPDLIAPLAKLVPLTPSQVEKLRKLKARFDTELAKPPLDRTVSIYNDELYRRVLETTVAQVAPAGR